MDYQHRVLKQTTKVCKNEHNDHSTFRYYANASSKISIVITTDMWQNSQENGNGKQFGVITSYGERSDVRCDAGALQM